MMICSRDDDSLSVTDDALMYHVLAS